MFCDTDSMAIIATDTGGLIPCPGGGHEMPDGTTAVNALTHRQVEAIRRRFGQLNPYDRGVVPDLLKAEERGLSYAIAAKRYVICNRDADGTIRILKASEHGLGRYLDPVSPTKDRRTATGGRRWIHDVWTWILAMDAHPDAPMPDWADLPAVSRVTVSSPVLLRPFTGWNAGQDWPDQLKPFNFLLTATLDPFGRPAGDDDTDKIRLIAPYSSNSDDWDQLEWRNVYDPDGPSYRITTDWQPTADDDVAVVQSCADVLRDYRVHTEAKFLGPDGQPCRRITRGVLNRRPVGAVGTPALIGKEANRLEDVQNGLVADLDEVLTTYLDPAEEGEVLADLVLPVLARYTGRKLARLVGCDRRQVDRVRHGQRPRRELLLRLMAHAAAIAAADLKIGVEGAGADRRLRVLAAWKSSNRFHGWRRTPPPYSPRSPCRYVSTRSGGRTSWSSPRSCPTGMWCRCGRTTGRRTGASASTPCTPSNPSGTPCPTSSPRSCSPGGYRPSSAPSGSCRSGPTRPATGAVTGRRGR